MNVKINFLGERKFSAKVRNHVINADLPSEKGGADSAPTPVELFAASVGLCAGFYARAYLETAKLNPEGLSVSLDWDFDAARTKVEKIDIVVDAPNAKLGERKKALLLAVDKCIVHNTLREYPKVNINVRQ